MPILIDEAFLPVTITASPMSDDEFEMFCSEHPDLSFEMTAEGIIIITAPHYPLAGIRNQEIIGQLQRWTAQDGRGVGADSSTGFVLPNGGAAITRCSVDPEESFAAVEPGKSGKILASLPGLRDSASIALGSYSHAARKDG